MTEVDLVIGNADKMKAETYQPMAFGVPLNDKVQVNDIMAVREQAGHLIEGLDGRTRAFVQVPGHAYRMAGADLATALRESPRIERLVHRYILALFDQAAQHAACNRLHALEERCARWLLMTHDRVDGDVLPLKQQFLAEMLGVHRPAVTIAAGALQKAGVIRYTRGKVTVLDRAALEEASCECYGIIARRAAELLDQSD